MENIKNRPLNRWRRVVTRTGPIAAPFLIGWFAVLGTIQGLQVWILPAGERSGQMEQDNEPEEIKLAQRVEPALSIFAGRDDPVRFDPEIAAQERVALTKDQRAKAKRLFKKNIDTLRILAN